MYSCGLGDYTAIILMWNQCDHDCLCWCVCKTEYVNGTVMAMAFAIAISYDGFKNIADKHYKSPNSLVVSMAVMSVVTADMDMRVSTMMSVMAVAWVSVAVVSI